jgi:WD40 repeat protein
VHIVRAFYRWAGWMLGLGVALAFCSRAAAWSGTRTARVKHPDPVVINLDGHGGRVAAVSWSPDGKRLASGSWDNTVRIWDVEGRTTQFMVGTRWPAPTDPLYLAVHSVAWHPGNGGIAAGNHRGEVRLIDPATGTVRWVNREGQGVVRTAVWSPDGSTLATAEHDGIVRLWRDLSGKAAKLIEEHPHAGWAAAWSPNGESFAIDSGNNIDLISVGRGEVTATLRGHRDWVLTISWSPDGQRIASGSQDGTMRIWDARRRAPIRTLRTGAWAIDCVAWSPDGGLLAVGGPDRTVQVWDGEARKRLLTLKKPPGAPASMAWSPDGRSLAIGYHGGNLQIWKLSEAAPSTTSPDME